MRLIFNVFSRKKELVGLDIGSSAIKAAIVKKTEKRFLLKKFAIANYEPGIIKDGMIKDFKSAAQTIVQLFKNNSIKNRKAAVSIGGQSVIVKKIQIKKLTEQNPIKAILYEAENYIPYNIDDVYFDYNILGRDENRPDLINVLIAAAQKELVLNYKKLVCNAGLKPYVIDVDVAALQNIFELNYNTLETTAIIHTGASKTSLNIIKKKETMFTRDVAMGCREIDKKIALHLDCSQRKAESIRLSKDRGELIKEEELKEISLSVVQGWCSEIKRAFDFFYSKYPKRINNIILSGGGANIALYLETLEKTFSTKVKIIDPFKKIEIDKNLSDSLYIKENGPQAAICLGLALRKTDDK